MIVDINMKQQKSFHPLSIKGALVDNWDNFKYLDPYIILDTPLVKKAHQCFYQLRWLKNFKLPPRKNLNRVHHSPDREVHPTGHIHQMLQIWANRISPDPSHPKSLSSKLPLMRCCCQDRRNWGGALTLKLNHVGVFLPLCNPKNAIICLWLSNIQ